MYQDMYMSSDIDNVYTLIVWPDSSVLRSVFLFIKTISPFLYRSDICYEGSDKVKTH